MDYQRVFLANPIAGIAVFTLILAGCGGVGGGPVDPNVGQTPAWTQACGTPETLFPTRSLNNGAYDLGIISSIAADSELVFFATDRAVYRASTAGGEPELLIPWASAYSIDKIWQVGGRYLATRMYGGTTISVLELPRAGTALDTVIDSIPVRPEEYKYGLIKVFWIDENYVYWQATRPFTLP